MDVRVWKIRPRLMRKSPIKIRQQMISLQAKRLMNHALKENDQRARGEKS